MDFTFPWVILWYFTPLVFSLWVVFSMLAEEQPTRAETILIFVLILAPGTNISISLLGLWVLWTESQTKKRLIDWMGEPSNIFNRRKN